MTASELKIDGYELLYHIDLAEIPSFVGPNPRQHEDLAMWVNEAQDHFIE